MSRPSGYRPRYVFMAIGALVVLILIAASIDPTGALALPVALGGVALLMAFIFIYQWQTVGQGRTPAPAPLGPGEHKDPGAITDPDQMLDLLALRPVKPEERLDASRTQTSIVRASIVLGVVVTVIGIGFTTLLETRVIDPNSLGNGEWTRYLPIILLPFGFLWVRIIMGRSQASSNQTFDPLGLVVTQMPQVGVRPRMFQGGMQTDVRGATVIEGNRHGHAVRVELGRAHVTTVSAAVPDFEITAEDGRLQAGRGAPAAAREVVESLGSSPHWKKLKQIKGGAGGIVAERKVDTENGWMWDLWLAETLAAALGAKP